jgi:hypothetical protein
LEEPHKKKINEQDGPQGVGHREGWFVPAEVPYEAGNEQKGTEEKTKEG